MSPSSPSPLHQPLRGLPGWLVILGALTAIGPLSIDMYLPAFPVIASDLSGDVGQVQLTLALFLIGLAFGQLFYGPVSDRFGRKPPLYAGLTLYVAASVAIACADSLASMQWLRVLQALGGCTGVVVARAVVRDRCDAASSARAFSLLTLVMGAAPILAPILGSAMLGYFSWRSIFVALALFGIALLLAVHFGLRETVDRSQQPPLRLGRVWQQYGELFRHRQFLLFALCGGLGSAGMFAYIAGSPFVLINLYGIEPAHFSWVFGANALGLIVASQVNGWLLRRYSMGQLLAFGLWLVAAATVTALLATLAGSNGLWLLLAMFFLYMVGAGFIYPNAVAISLASQGRRAGTAAALMGALQFGLGTLAGVAMSLWHDGTALPLVAVMAGCSGGAWFIYMALARHHDRDHQVAEAG